MDGCRCVGESTYTALSFSRTAPHVAKDDPETTGGHLAIRFSLNTRWQPGQTGKLLVNTKNVVRRSPRPCGRNGFSCRDQTAAQHVWCCRSPPARRQRSGERDQSALTRTVAAPHRLRSPPGAPQLPRHLPVAPAWRPWLMIF